MTVKKQLLINHKTESASRKQAEEAEARQQLQDNGVVTGGRGGGQRSEWLADILRSRGSPEC